jgi:hypothetical protein
MASNKRRRVVGAIVVLIGAILLIVAAFTPWYAESFKVSFEGYSITITANSYPGIPSSNGTIQYTCSGLPSAASCPSQTSYKDARLNNTGNIAEAGYFMAIVGFILGFIGAILGVASRTNPRRAGPAIALAVVAMILAVAAFGLFAALIPGAIGSDTPGHTGTGPWSSFTGSANTTSFGIPIAGTLSWGPSIGWYIAIVAFVILLIGVILLFRYRKDPAEPVPVAAPAPTTGTSTPTQTTPPSS